MLRWSRPPATGEAPAVSLATNPTGDADPTGVPPGSWTSVGRWLREPVGRIIWAGTETADEWTGFLDGAVRSGLRAAAEVADALA